LVLDVFDPAPGMVFERPGCGGATREESGHARAKQTRRLADDAGAGEGAVGRWSPGREAQTDAVQEADDLAPAMPARELQESYQRALRDAAEGRVRRFSSLGALKQWLDE